MTTAIAPHEAPKTGPVVVLCEETWLCQTEGCNHRPIPKDRTCVIVDKADRSHRKYAHCESCGRLFMVRRPVGAFGHLGAPEFGIVTEAAARASILKKLDTLRGDVFVEHRSA